MVGKSRAKYRFENMTDTMLFLSYINRLFMRLSNCDMPSEIGSSSRGDTFPDRISMVMLTELDDAGVENLNKNTKLRATTI